LKDFKQELKKIGAGRTATIFRYGQNQAIKLFKASFPRQAINDEFEIGRSLNTRGLSIPRTYELIEVDHTKGIVLDFINGRSMLQNLAKKPWFVLTYAKKMARLHFAIHKASIARNNWIKSLSKSLAEKISRVTLLSTEEQNAVLQDLASLPDGSALCHGDFHPDNILMSKDGLVTVDWITARIGNSVADVARTWLLLSMATLPEDKSRIEVFLAKHLRDSFCRSYLKEYQTLSNISLEDLEKWKLPVAAARLIEDVSDQENQNLLKFIRMKLNKA
jgi:aminoglycoside phosphotransferase (APT) family kinase protein